MVAFLSWKRLSQDERATYLNRFADAIEANRGEFIELLGKEVGKPPQAGGFELSLVMGLARETPKLRLKEEKIIDDAEVRNHSPPINYLVFLYSLIIVAANRHRPSCPSWRWSRYCSMELSSHFRDWKIARCSARWEYLHLEAIPIRSIFGIEAC